jgi:hypothetical protein
MVSCLRVSLSDFCAGYFLQRSDEGSPAFLLAIIGPETQVIVSERNIFSFHQFSLGNVKFSDRNGAGARAAVHRVWQETREDHEKENSAREERPGKPACANSSVFAQALLLMRASARG